MSATFEEIYRPFDLRNQETRDKLRDKWVFHKDSNDEYKISGFVYTEGNTYNILLLTRNGERIITSLSLMNNFVFTDGSPCAE